MKLVYGDSTTGTYASGLIGSDDVEIAGLGLGDQTFLAVNDTNNVSVENGAAGVLGLGFPSERYVKKWHIVYSRPHLSQCCPVSSDFGRKFLAHSCSTSSK